ncbi:phage portal protein, SPP1 family [Paenibacillus naphthalenovorans]|nr:phage portal protein, SPP1 family [Paenibacillus naphthalenovorans]
MYICLPKREVKQLDISKILAAGAASAMTTEQIIKMEIDSWKKSDELRWMVTGQKYYEGDHDILKRKRLVIGMDGQQVEDKNLANNKLVHSIVRKLVDQKVGYLLSKPISIQAKNNTYDEALRGIFDKGFLRLMKNIGKDAINKGRGWLQVYYDENKLAFKRLPPNEVIPLWKDAAHTQLDAIIRVYEVETYEGTTKKIVTKVEFWNHEGVRRYVMGTGDSTLNTSAGLLPDVEAGDVDSHFSVVDADGKERHYNWERVPFVCFKYNDEEQPLIKFIKSLVDDYDLQTSDNSNNLTDLPNSIYVLKEYDDEDLAKFRQNLAAYRAVKVTGGGGVDTLNLEINTEAMKNHLELLRKDIYEFGRGVDTQATDLGSSPSGISLKFLYADLDMDANIIETEFQASLEQLLWFIDQHLNNSGIGDFSNEDVEIIFNRDILINETDAITNAKNSVGIISDETIVANHPWVTNTKDEMKRMEKQREAETADPYEEISRDPNREQPFDGVGAT